MKLEINDKKKKRKKKIRKHRETKQHAAKQ